MIKSLIDWFFSPSQKFNDNNTDVYTQLLQLKEKYESLLLDIKRLEEENIETTNTLYELSNSIDAVDARIDILTLENWNKKDV